jgi:hypothetical protein
MQDREIIPYYTCFCEWLGIMNPGTLFAYQRGMLGVEQIKPLVRAWAADITKKEKETK